MNRITLLLVAIVGMRLVAVTMAAQPSDNRTLDHLRVITRLQNGDVGVLREIYALPVEGSDEMLREVMDKFRCRDAHIYEAAVQTLATLPDASALYERRLAELPHLHENTQMRALWMSVLQQIRARWSLNLLAKYLFDERPLESKHRGVEMEVTISQLGGSVSNRRMAAASIGAMGIKNIPTSGPPILYTDKEEQLLRQWWRENEHQPDSFFFDGTPPIPNARAAASTTTSTPPRSTPAPMHDALQQATDLAKRESLPGWKLGFALIAAIATTLALWAAFLKLRRG